MEQRNLKVDIMLALFVGSMIIVNTIGSKITTMFGIRVSVGIIFMPLLFLITDMISEVYGRDLARRFVKISTGLLVFMFVMIFLAIQLPPDSTYAMQSEFEMIFGGSLRMTFASIISFAVSQYFDVSIFSFWKKVTRGKHLWLRNNASTISSQFIDTTIFMFIAFYQMTPQYTAAFVFSLIIPYWLFKIAFAFIDTPLCYLGVRWLRGEAMFRRRNSPQEESTPAS